MTRPVTAGDPAIAVNRIIEQAARLSRDKDFSDVWKQVYEPARKAIAEFDLPPREHLEAIARLAEAMRV